MSEIEKRRLKLLEETRKTYSDKFAPPAIHPRFRATYTSIYGSEEGGKVRSTFVIRTVIAILVFTMVYIIDSRKERVGNINSKQVIYEVQRTLISQ